jgi:antitoxin StbD
MMVRTILSNVSASVAELKRNPMDTVAAGEGFPVAILNRNEPVFYCVPAKAYESLMEQLEDLELNAIAEYRNGQQTMRVSVDEL